MVTSVYIKKTLDAIECSFLIFFTPSEIQIHLGKRRQRASWYNFRNIPFKSRMRQNVHSHHHCCYLPFLSECQRSSKRKRWENPKCKRQRLRRVPGKPSRRTEKQLGKISEFTTGAEEAGAVLALGHCRACPQMLETLRIGSGARQQAPPDTNVIKSLLNLRCSNS